jgi:hypothetical protein
MKEFKMSTYTFWKADCLDDANCYSIRGKTKKEVLELLKNANCILSKDADGNPCFVDSDSPVPRFALPHKVTIQFEDRMGLINELMGEGGSYY